MRLKEKIAKPLLMLLIIAMTILPSTSLLALDWGTFVQESLSLFSSSLFGIAALLPASAPETDGPFRTPEQEATEQVLLAEGLQVQYLTREAGNATDMMTFFPLDSPTHLITCVEGGSEAIPSTNPLTPCAAGLKCNPSVQRIDLSSGTVETILRGLSRCDGIRTTSWGTILATEETDDGGAYEILAPLTTSELTVVDRATGEIQDATGTPVTDAVAKRTALPTMAWEGLAVLPSGVVIGGDELRPGSIDVDGDGTADNDTDGGALYKFVPATPRTGTGVIASLDESPLVAGTVHALQVSCVDDVQQFGQGCEIGNASWIAVDAATARADANANGATGYYRPEDLHRDPLFVDPANAEAVRVCWTNTGNTDASNFSEVMCAVDTAPLTVDPETRTVTVQRFIEGDLDFNAFDNLEFHPITGNLYVIEDNPNGDIFACLADGADRDLKSDGCAKVLSVADSSAEPTGFIFAANGQTAYLSIQHSDDALMPLVDDYPSDDILIITGFQMPAPSGT